MNLLGALGAVCLLSLFAAVLLLAGLLAWEIGAAAFAVWLAIAVYLVVPAATLKRWFWPGH